MASKYNKKVETILVTALAKGATVAQAARQAGVSERTVYRRRQHPEFQARIDAIQNDMLQRVTALLPKAAEEGIHSLVTLQEKSTPPSVRRAAARDILDVGMRLREAADLEKRLLALENGVANAGASSAAPAGSPPPNRKGSCRCQVSSPNRLPTRLDPWLSPDTRRPRGLWLHVAASAGRGHDLHLARTLE
jgi:transposase-like protein